jgi:hypothetical protein
MSDFFNSTTQPTKKEFGFLLRVRSKKTDRHPDMEGELPIAGKKYLLAGWVRVSKKGNRYLSLSARPDPEDQNEVQNSAAAAPPKQQQEQQPAEIEIPF